MSSLQFSAEDLSALTSLEEAMWKADTRFNVPFQEARFAPDFFEFGSSGRVYQRQDVIRDGGAPIEVSLPLPNLEVRMLDANTAQLTYDSAVVYSGVVEHAHRSSIWSRSPSGWIMRFHQGTPFRPQPIESSLGNADAA